MSAPSEEPLFREVQAFRQAWMQALVWFTAAGAFAPLVVQIADGGLRAGQRTGDLVFAALVAAAGVALAIFMRRLHLLVEVRSDRVLLRFVPLLRREIPLEEIALCEPRTYRPLREYGGWGIRWSIRHGKAYNVSGNRGVQLELFDGKRILIGSQRPEDLAEAIRRAKHRL